MVASSSTAGVCQANEIVGLLEGGSINQVYVDELASLSTEQLLDRLRDHLRPQGLATTFGGRLALLDVTIHHQDIRRPLGKPRQIPADRLRCVLGDAVRSPELPGRILSARIALPSPCRSGYRFVREGGRGLAACRHRP
ncbi:hypothetical protein [Raineyella antarctica]|uniref:hypothetical protein n=1 Tax=Raineyella antarctica TaxID=1577474 RepID=UPI000A6124B0|nr:hypothetical protein [Raineyella antarctica]